jgi:hypothetical protein
MKAVMKAIPVIALVVLGGRVAADDAAKPLVIGYENEGKVEASEQACLGFVKEITLWSKSDIERGARTVCEARKRHVVAYDSLQKNYRALTEELKKDVRLDPEGAGSGLVAMMRGCMEHKTSLTTGGHNIMIDVIENDVAARCLALGTSMLREELDVLRSTR